MLLWFGGQALRADRPDHVPDGVFAATQIRDVRLALEVYHREHAHYPARLEDLAEDRWIEHSQLTVGGRLLHYRLDRAHDTYELDVPDLR